MVVLKLTKLTMESDFEACKVGSLWKAKKATKQEKERGGHPPTNLGSQNSVPATENPLDFSGEKAKQSMQLGLRCKAQNKGQSSIQGST